MNELVTPLELRLPAALVKKLAAANITTVGELLHHAPRRYYHWGNLTAMNSLQFGQDVTLLARVASCALIANQRGGVRFEVTLTDGLSTMTATFFGKNQYSLIPHQRLLTKGSTHLFAGKVGQYRGKLQLTHPQFEESAEGDEQAAKARQERPIPIYPLTGGLTPWVMQRAIGMILDNLDVQAIPEIIPEEIRARYGLLSHVEALRMLHQPASDDDYRNAQHTLRWQEAFALQTVLGMKRQGLSASKSFPAPRVSSPNTLSMDVREALPFTLTSAQNEAVQAIEKDLECDQPMMRLLQGDVGSGKTVIALLASAQMLDAGYQVAFMVPTEVLAEQHAESIRELCGKISPSLAVLTASTSAAQRDAIHQRLAAGEAIVLIGTHALLQESVPFTNLGLVIIDEQHRFGVAQRDLLRERFTVNGRVPHQLVMTATPIPRTVAMTVFGDLEETRMTGLPPGRTPIQTYLVDAANSQWMERMWSRAAEEISTGGRVYVVCPRIDADTESATPEQSSGNPTSSAEDEYLFDDFPLARCQNPQPTPSAASAQRPPLASVEAVSKFLASTPLLGGHRIVTLTSRHSAAEKTAIMQVFSSGQAPILVATTVIEVGVNVPEATMMVILDAQQFGLSQLHQLRGRVGRSDTQAVCMAVHRHGLSGPSMARLEAFAATTDGFELAKADMTLRREGDVLGADQSGRSTSLKFLSVQRDETLIEQARAASLALLTDDPALAAYPSLLAHVKSLEGQQTQWMDKA